MGKATALGVWLSLAILILCGCGSTAPNANPPEVGPSTGQSYADELWDMVLSTHPEAERPDVSIVRYVQPDESATVKAACLVEQGFTDTEVLPDGGIVTDYGPEAQALPFALANYICRVQYPLDPKYTAPLTDAEISEVYDYFVEELSSCLEAEGYEVEPAPSRSTFTDGYLSGTSWNPYELVATQNLTNEQWWAINSQCPQMPPTFRK